MLLLRLRVANFGKPGNCMITSIGNTKKLSKNANLVPQTGGQLMSLDSGPVTDSYNVQSVNDKGEE